MRDIVWSVMRWVSTMALGIALFLVCPSVLSQVPLHPSSSTLGLSHPNGAVFVPQRREIAVFDLGSIRILDLETLAVLKCFDMPSRLEGPFACSPDTPVFATYARALVQGSGVMAVYERAVYVLDVQTESLARFSDPDCCGGVFSLALSSGGEYLAVGGKAVCIWSAKGGDLRLKIPEDAVTALAFSPGNDRVAMLKSSVSGSGDEQSVIEVWDLATGRRLFRAETVCEGTAWGYRQVAWIARESRDLVIAACPTAVEVFDIGAGKLLASLPGSSGLALHPSGRLLLAANAVWETATGEKVCDLPNMGGVPLSFSADGSLLLVGNKWGDVIGGFTIWSTAPDCSQFRLVREVRFEGWRPVTDVAVCPGGRLFASFSPVAGPQLWEIQEGPIPPRSVSPTSAPEVFVVGSAGLEKAKLFGALAVRFPRELLAFRMPSAGICPCGAVEGWGIRVLKGKTYLEIHPPPTYGGPFFAVMWGGSLFLGTDLVPTAWASSADGKHFVLALASLHPDAPLTSLEGHVVLVDVAKETPRWVREFHKGVVNAVLIGPGGDRVISGSEDHSAVVWDANTGELLHWLPNGAPVLCLAVDQKEQLLACGLENGNIYLWELRTGDPVCQFVGHGAEVTSLSFTPDGALLVSGSYDSTVRLWEVPGR